MTWYPIFATARVVPISSFCSSSRTEYISTATRIFLPCATAGTSGAAAVAARNERREIDMDEFMFQTVSHRADGILGLAHVFQLTHLRRAGVLVTSVAAVTLYGAMQKPW